MANDKAGFSGQRDTRRMESVKPDKKEAGHADEVKVMRLRVAHRLIEMC